MAHMLSAYFPNNAALYGHDALSDYAALFGHAALYGHDALSNHAALYDYAALYGHTALYDYAALYGHAVHKNSILKFFRAGENSKGSAAVWALPRHKPLRAKNLVSTIFFILFLIYV